MSQFEFVMTGVSILLAIMIGKIITTLSMLRRKNVDHRHAGWLIVLSLHLVFFWWFGWRYSEVQFNVYGYLALILPTFVLMFVISLFTPSEIPDDWSEYFEITRRKFFASYAVFWVALGISQFVLTKEIQPSIVPFVLCLAGLASKHRIMQWGVLILMGTTFLIIGLFIPESLGT